MAWPNEPGPSSKSPPVFFDLSFWDNFIDSDIFFFLDRCLHVADTTVQFCMFCNEIGGTTDARDGVSSKLDLSKLQQIRTLVYDDWADR